MPPHLPRTISLNSTESLPIPPRSSSRGQVSPSPSFTAITRSRTPGPPSPNPSRIAPPSQLARYSYSNSNGNGTGTGRISPGSSPSSPRLPRANADSDNRSDTSSVRSGRSAHSSPSSPPPGSGRSSRTNSFTQARKPVPAYLPMPNTELPSDHPFSSSHLRSPSLGTGANAGAGRRSPNHLAVGGGKESPLSGSEAGTPGWKEDKDLFFGAPVPTPPIGSPGAGLPPPPRRKNVRRNPVPQATGDVAPTTPVQTTSAIQDHSVGDTVADPQEVLRRGTFDGGLNIYLPDSLGATSSGQITTASTTTSTAAGYETARTAPSFSSGSSTPNPNDTPRTITSVQVDRPLPPLPDGASVFSLGLSSILGTGPESNTGDEYYTRSNSSDSRAAPLTPRMHDYAPSSPIVHGLDGDAASSAGSHRNVSAVYKRGSVIARPGQNGTGAGAGTAEEEEEEFSVSRPPSKRKLWEAGTHFVRDEEGKLIYFGDLFPKWDADNTKPPPSHTKAEVASMASTASLSLSARQSEPPATATTGINADPNRPPPKTVLFFIRNFWCGQCQDYMFASICFLDPEAIAKANIRIAVISTGSYKFIKKYRKLTKCPFPIYVDGSEKLYNLLGMIEQFGKFGPWFKGRAAYNQSPVPLQIVNSFKRAPRLHIGSSPGNMSRMGGEFVLEPGFECSFAHRMTNFSNHMEAPDVLRLAGCTAPTKDEVLQNKLAADEQVELERLQQEMSAWRTDRESELDRIRRKKAERRGVMYNPATNTSKRKLGLDVAPTPAFGATTPAGDRRESDVSAITTFTAATETQGMQPIRGLEVSVEDAASTHTDEVEELEEKQGLGANGEDGVSDAQLDKEFEEAMRVDEWAKERYEGGRRDTITA